MKRRGAQLTDVPAMFEADAPSAFTLVAERPRRLVRTTLAMIVPLAVGLLALGACGGSDGGSAPPTTNPTPTPTPTSASKWVAAWADAPSEAAGPASSEQTFREIVKPTVGSRGTVRLHFSNVFGTTPVTIGGAHVGIQTTGPGVTGDVSVTFAGSGSVTIPAGGYATSDQIPMSFRYGDVLSVTEYVKGSWGALTGHNQAGSNVTSYQTPGRTGDRTSDVNGSAFTQTTFNTYLLDRVDVFGAYKGTVAAFGSSTTDGLQSGLDQHMTYPEQLAAALHAAGRDDVAIANVGISGNEVLGSGATAGVNRFARDVLGLPGIVSVIEYLGANDLRGSCIKAETLIAGKRTIADQARSAGVRLFLATTAPSTFCGGQNPSGFGSRFAEGSGEDAQRFLINAWDASTQPSIVNGTTVQPPKADAIIDFDAALVDPANRSYMLSRFDSGDDIHPNSTGYAAMVKAIPLSLF